jgi:hypothetical protein
MADIERQYEFIQANWCNDGARSMSATTATRSSGARRRPQVHDPRRRAEVRPPLAELVTTRGGEYLWVPSIDGLRRLANADWSAPRRRVDTLGRGRASRHRARSLGAAIGFARQARRSSRRRRLRGNRRRRGCGLGPVGRHGARTTRLVPSRRATVAGFGIPLRWRDVHGIAVRMFDAGGPAIRKTCSSRPRTGSRRDATRHRSRATSRSSRRCSASARQTAR